MPPTQSAPADKPYVVLTRVNSESKLDTVYEIRISKKDGVRYCSCPGFFMHGKRCKHMDAFVRAERSGQLQVDTRPVANPAPHPTFATRRPMSAGRVSRTLRESAPPPTSPASILQRELVALNLIITDQQAASIAAKIQLHVLSTLKPQAPEPIRVENMTVSSVTLNGENIRLITLPD